LSEVGFEGALDGLGVEAFEACGEVVEVGVESDQVGCGMKSGPLDIHVSALIHRRSGRGVERECL
jgi:hypothetical protein